MGMNAVVNSLKECKGWSRGLVEFSTNNVTRKNGVATGFNKKMEVINEEKMHTSALLEQVQYSKKESSTKAPNKICSEGKSKKARAKLVRNKQRPRINRRGAWTSARDVQEQIMLGKEYVFSRESVNSIIKFNTEK